MPVSVVCRCGHLLEETGARPPEPVVLVCPRCSLNHRFQWAGGRPVLVMRYYFPDD